MIIVNRKIANEYVTLFYNNGIFVFFVIPSSKYDILASKIN